MRGWQRRSNRKAYLCRIQKEKGSVTSRRRNEGLIPFSWTDSSCLSGPWKWELDEGKDTAVEKHSALCCLSVCLITRWWEQESLLMCGGQQGAFSPQCSGSGICPGTRVELWRASHTHTHTHTHTHIYIKHTHCKKSARQNKNKINKRRGLSASRTGQFHFPSYLK